MSGICDWIVQEIMRKVFKLLLENTMVVYSGENILFVVTLDICLILDYEVIIVILFFINNLFIYSDNVMIQIVLSTDWHEFCSLLNGQIIISPYLLYLHIIFFNKKIVTKVTYISMYVLSIIDKTDDLIIIDTLWTRHICYFTYLKMN